MQLTQEQLKELLADQVIQIRALEITVRNSQQRIQELTDENIKLKSEKENG